MKGRDRNRLTNRKLDLNRKRAGDGTAVLLVFLRVVMPGSCCQDFLLVTVEPGLSETDPCADARTSGRLTAFACAAHAPVSRVRARRCFRARVVSGIVSRSLSGPRAARGWPRCAEFFVELGTSAHAPNEA